MLLVFFFVRLKQQEKAGSRPNFAAPLRHRMPAASICLPLPYTVFHSLTHSIVFSFNSLYQTLKNLSNNRIHWCVLRSFVYILKARQFFEFVCMNIRNESNNKIHGKHKKTLTRSLTHSIVCSIAYNNSLSFRLTTQMITLTFIHSLHLITFHYIHTRTHNRFL